MRALALLGVVARASPYGVDVGLVPVVGLPVAPLPVVVGVVADRVFRSADL